MKLILILISIPACLMFANGLSDVATVANRDGATIFQEAVACLEVGFGMTGLIGVVSTLAITGALDRIYDMTVAERTMEAAEDGGSMIRLAAPLPKKISWWLDKNNPANR